MKTTKTKMVVAALPKGINKTDLKYPSWRSKDRQESTFELWHVTSFGWCIPTLLIRKSCHAASFTNNQRTYAVRISDGGTVRIGLGPHVTGKVRVYVRKSRAKVLAKFTDLIEKGGTRANEIRDRISTRRMQTSMYRTGMGW